MKIMKNKLLPEFTWIKTKTGATGPIMEVFDGDDPAYLVEYYPHSQVDEDADVTFFVKPEDVVEYKLPRNT